LPNDVCGDAVTMNASTAPEPRTGVATTILDVAATLLADGGLEALQLRDVAKLARVSLSTVYKHFPSRDALIVGAVEHWMSENVYDALPLPDPDLPLTETLIHFFRQFLTPWTTNPTMLGVCLHAALLPGGDQISAHGMAAISPIAAAMFAGYDPELVADIATVLSVLTDGLMSRFATGKADLAEITRVYERAVVRLTAAATTRDNRRR
jgi:TetR/AcrR family transcriptional regulator, cholesterol catabolism regulator